MQREVGNLTDSGAIPAFVEITRKFFLHAVETGSFASWVAETGTGALVAASGLVIYEKPPSFRGLGGRVGYVSNVYTLPQWRGRGIATLLMEEMIAFAKQNGVNKLTLGATDSGKRVYERVGFKSQRHEPMELILT